MIQGNPGKTYICGKGITRFDEMTAEAARLIDVIRQNDSRRMVSMIDSVREIFAAHGLETGIDAKAVIEMIVLPARQPARNGVPCRSGTFHRLFRNRFSRRSHPNVASNV